MTTVANTILQQINTLNPLAMMDWGTAFNQKVSIKRDDMEGLMLKTKGAVRFKGFIEILLGGDDLYVINFVQVRKYERKVRKTVEGVYNVMLVDIIDDVVLKGNI